MYWQCLLVLADIYVNISRSTLKNAATTALYIFISAVPTALARLECSQQDFGWEIVASLKRLPGCHRDLHNSG